LRYLRKSLGGGVVVSRGPDEVGVDLDLLWCDAAEFRRALEEGRLEDAVELYQGDLLEGLYLSDSLEFERWVEAERAWLRNEAAKAAWGLAGQCESDGQRAQAAHWARRALDLEPVDEGRVQRAMDLLDRVGDRAGAIKVYETLARRLREEYELEPSPETSSLAEAIRAREELISPVREGGPATEASPVGQSGAPEPPDSPGVTAEGGEERVSARVESSAVGERTPVVSDGEGVVGRMEGRRGGGPAGYRWMIRRRLPPMLLVAAAAVMLLWWLARDGPIPMLGPEDLSVAVLPLAYHSDLSGDAYLAEGTHSQIITQLSKIASLRVTPLQSVRRFQDSSLSTRQIGRQLNVRFLVSGQVTRVVGTQVRLNLNLTDTFEEAVVWSDSWGPESNAEELLGVQSEAATAIAEALQVELSPEERRRLEPVVPTDEAYRLFLRGLVLSHFDPEENEEAIRLYRRAVEIDSLFPAAYARLAFRQHLQVQNFLHPRALADTGRALARKAIDLSDQQAEGFHALGSNLRLLGRLSEAESAHNRALDLSPRSSEFLNALGVLDRDRGRYVDALRKFGPAAILDPAYPMLPANLGVTFLLMDELDEARRWVERALEVQGDHSLALLAAVYIEIRRPDWDSAWALARAIQKRDELVGSLAVAEVAWFDGEAETASSILADLYRYRPRGRNPGTGRSIALSYALALQATGAARPAAEIFREAEEQALDAVSDGDESPATAMELAAIHAARDEKEAAYEWLERAYELGWRVRSFNEHDPVFESLRGEVRFRALLDRMEADLTAMREQARELERWRAEPAGAWGRDDG
jgi:TolB-like protein/Tfp pilus assembly protein PilF